MDRPKLKIELDTADWIMEIFGATFLILLIGIPIYYFDQLPETIPTHFNSAGEPDKFGQKKTIWTMPILGTFIYAGVFVLNKFPYVFNYPKEITQENAERQYRMATKLMRTLNLTIAAGFTYIGYSSIQTALYKGEGLGIYFMPFFLIFIFGTMGTYLYLTLKGISEKR